MNTKFFNISQVSDKSNVRKGVSIFRRRKPEQENEQ